MFPKGLATQYVFARNGFKSGHPLKFDVIVACNVAQVESGSTSAILYPHTTISTVATGCYLDFARNTVLCGQSLIL